MPKSSILALLLTYVILGCSAKPLPENFTGINTYQISQKIRCEMRDAIRTRILNFLDSRSSLDSKAGEFARQLRANPDGFINFGTRERHSLSEPVRTILDRYDSGAIAYDFTFTVTEQNLTQGSIGFGENLTRGLLTLSGSGSADKVRKNVRNFVIVDNFERLVRYYGVGPDGHDFCPTFEKGENLKYPITGDLGMDEVTQTFFSLGQYSNLRARVPGKDLSLLGETMEFTTTLKLGAKAEVKLSAVGDVLKVTSGNLSSDLTRIDEHKLILALALPEDSKVASPSAAEQDAIARATRELEIQRLREVQENAVLVGERLLTLE